MKDVKDGALAVLIVSLLILWMTPEAVGTVSARAVKAYNAEMLKP